MLLLLDGTRKSDAAFVLMVIQMHQILAYKNIYSKLSAISLNLSSWNMLTKARNIQNTKFRHSELKARNTACTHSELKAKIISILLSNNSRS
jgi:hypothetical protein